MNGRSFAAGVAIGVGGLLLVMAASRLIYPLIVIGAIILVLFMWRRDEPPA